MRLAINRVWQRQRTAFAGVIHAWFALDPLAARPRPAYFDQRSDGNPNEAAGITDAVGATNHSILGDT
jgi:hypothetical protein